MSSKNKTLKQILDPLTFKIFLGEFKTLESIIKLSRQSL